MKKVVLADHLYYDETAKSCLRRAVDSVKRRFTKGGETGSISTSHGYYTVYVARKQHLVHRVIWELINGPIPDGYQVDHIDGNPLNNKIDNLRIVLPIANSHNLSKSKRNKTGTTGIASLEFRTKYGAYKYYSAAWQEDGKSKTKRFSVGKLGEEVALRLAIDFRRQKIEELNLNGAGYTRRHGEPSPRKNLRNS